jgi:hypothetical protein
VNRVRQRLWGEERKKEYFSATLNTCSVNRVRRRLWGEERKKRREYFFEVNLTMNLQCEPCQAAAVGKDRKEYLSEVNSTMNLQCEPCQAADVGRGKKEKKIVFLRGQRDHELAV